MDHRAPKIDMIAPLTRLHLLKMNEIEIMKYICAVHPVV